MHLILAIIFKELTAWPRQKRFYLKRLILVSLSSIVFLFYYFESINSKTGVPTNLGFEVFEVISILSILTVILSSPMISSSFFAREKEQRTLGILLITEVTPFQLVLSRFIMSIFSNVVSLIAIWPILLICLRYGGLNFNHIWVFTLLLISTMTVGTCIGLLVSTMMMEEKQAFFISIALGTIYFVALPALVHLSGDESGLALINETILPTISPVHTLKIFLESGTNLIFANLAASLSVSAMLFFLTVRLLPVEALRSPHDIDPRHAEIMDAAWRKKKPIKGNPLAWKERPHHSNLLFVFTVAISALIPMPWGIRTGNPQLAMGFGLFVAIVLVVGIGLIVRGALAFVNEKESRTFELLLISDLSDISRIEREHGLAGFVAGSGE